MESLVVLTSIAIILLLGLIATVISKRLNVSNVLILIVIGMLLNLVRYQGEKLFQFNPTFLLSMSILALVMITFDGTSRFTLKQVEQFSKNSIRIVLWFIFTNIILLGTFTVLIFYPGFSFQAVIFALIFAIVMVATDPGAIFAMMKERMTKAIGVLEIESIINTPIVVLLPFILIDLLNTDQIVDSFIDLIIPFTQQIVVGVGAGILVGIVIFKAMKNVYHLQLSPLGLITAALASYVLAENLGGNGILSVAIMGIFFGNVYVKRKITLQEFSSIFSNGLEILVFVLTGFLIEIEFTGAFLGKSLALFTILIISRWIAISISLRKEDFTIKDKLFMTLNMPKGIAVAAVIFSLSILNIEGIKIIIDLILAFVIYSLIISTIVDKYAKQWFNIKIQD